jgi:DNA invertase Pin-like site-specific DNA recombinase
MTSKNEPAGVWVRVSTGGQDEAQQVPAVEGHCDNHEYIIAKRYELNDKSASKGEQQAKLDEMLADMRDGTIKVLVCWRSNRLERRGPEALFKLLRQVKDARGRIESTTEPMLGTEDMSGEALTALGAVMDKQFSAKLSEDTLRAITSIKANGYVFNGNVPWGYEIIGPKYAKIMVPTEICRLYVPQIFARCIKGQSLRQIAAWLDSEHVPTARGGKWNEGSVRWIIRTRAYAGRWVIPERKKKGKVIKPAETVMESEAIAVISPSTFDRANQALKSRPKRGPVAKDNRPMLANLKCARCEDSPMYRIKASRGGSARHFYRCTGRGPQRKGCGNMVDYELTEFIVASQIFVHSTEPHTIKNWVDGQNWDDEISNVKQSIREAVEAERFEEMPALQAKLADYRSRDEISGHYDYVKTGQTVGEHFWSLDNDGRREYLATRDIRVEKVPTEVNLSGIRVVIDGQEHEVTVREWNAANRHLASVS